jgi:hypothetical protein
MAKDHIFVTEFLEAEFITELALQLRCDGGTYYDVMQQLSVVRASDPSYFRSSTRHVVFHVVTEQCRRHILFRFATEGKTQEWMGSR